MPNWVDKTTEKANAVLLFGAVGFLVTMAGIVVLNVIMRYGLHVSLTWSAELARYCMVWSAMLAAAVLVNKQKHLVVELVGRALPFAWRRWLSILIVLLSMVFYAAMLVSGTVFVARTAGQVASSIEAMPMNVMYAIIPVAALLMLAGCTMIAARTLYAKDRHSSRSISN